MLLELEQVVGDIRDSLASLDKTRHTFRSFQPGVGPFGEPQLVKLIAARLNILERYSGNVRTKRCPDMLISGEWALEFKIARPYGDNGKEAENWSVNLLHPYPGNVSCIGDCYKLLRLETPERKAIIVVGYEHAPAKISLTPLIESFEVVARSVARINLGPRIEEQSERLVHPVHQIARIFAWEVFPN